MNTLNITRQIMHVTPNMKQKNGHYCKKHDLRHLVGERWVSVLAEVGAGVLTV